MKLNNERAHLFTDKFLKYDSKTLLPTPAPISRYSVLVVNNMYIKEKRARAPIFSFSDKLLYDFDWTQFEMNMSKSELITSYPLG